MNDITADEKQQALRISRALQVFFNENPGKPVLRSTDAYDILVTKGLVERDRHQGVKFREFLYKLKKAGALSFIPQCQSESGNNNTTNWFFRSAPSVVAVKTPPTPSKFTNEELETFKSQISMLEKKPESSFSYVENETRKNYPRAYEYWSFAELNLLQDMAKRDGSTLELSKILGRQPSAIERKLKELEPMQKQS